MPLSLVGHDELLETGLERAVEPVHHAVSVQVVGRRLDGVDPQQVVEFAHQLAGEVGATICQDFVWDACPREHLQEGLGAGGRLEREGLGVPRAVVAHGENVFVSFVRGWKRSHHVHGHSTERGSDDGQRHERRLQSVLGPGLLTRLTPPAEVKSPLDAARCLCHSEVSGERGNVRYAEGLFSVGRREHSLHQLFERRFVLSRKFPTPVQEAVTRRRGLTCWAVSSCCSSAAGVWDSDPLASPSCGGEWWRVLAVRLRGRVVGRGRAVFSVAAEWGRFLAV